MKKLIFSLALVSHFFTSGAAMSHTPIETLHKKVTDTQQKVAVGSMWYHYRSPEKLYTVIAVALQESSEDACIVYQAQYGDKLTWVRNLDQWFSLVEVNGKSVSRFQQKAI